MLIKNQSFASVFLLAVAVIFVVYLGLLQEIGAEENAPIEKINCVRLMMKAAKTSMKSLSFCSKQLRANFTTNKEFGDKIGCVMKCTMQRVVLLNAEGHVTEESVMAQMRLYLTDKGMIEEARAKIYLPCVETALKLDPYDVTCKSYADYALCMQTGMEEFISTSPYCLPRKRI